jgi:hypothetical protein
MEPDTLLYGALISFLSDERAESVEAFTVLVEKLKSDLEINPHDMVAALVAVLDDLSDMGYFGEDNEDELDGEYEGDDLVEFEIRTLKDEDPKKRLN